MGLLGLVLLAAVIFLLGNLVLVPLILAAGSLAGALGAPGQFLRIASRPRLRRNHALEHATLNVLEERYGPQTLNGFSREDGFVLRGVGDPEAVRLAAEEGLARLKGGERRLAIHRRCGTSIAAANFVTSLALLILLFGFGRFNLVNVVLVMLLANLAGPVLGRAAQRFLTTSTDVSGLFITGVEWGVAARGWGLLVTDPTADGVPVVVFVRTAEPRVFGGKA